MPKPKAQIKERKNLFSKYAKLEDIANGRDINKING